MNQIKFLINGKEFLADIDLIRDDKFVIKSIPKNYSVSYTASENPFDVIESLLKVNEKNLLLIDEKLLKLYQPKWTISAERIFAAPATENFKSLDGVTKVIDFLQKNTFTKGEQLIVVGGGIIQDVGAFVGAVYKRGIPWLLFPSTLLSMCDSCIGGKTGVNYNGAKNQLALFSSPTAIYIHWQFLKTLTDDEIYSGLGEILKLCITGGDYFLDVYCQHVEKGRVKSFDSFKFLISKSLAVKKSVIEEDEFELNYRRSMNYGHTLGHAIESLSNHEIPHGQAVVVGMILVNELSYVQGLLSKENLTVLNELCFDLITQKVRASLQNIKLDSIISFIQKDKKTVGKYTSFVMIAKAGDTRFVQLELNEKLLLEIKNAFNTFN